MKAVLGGFSRFLLPAFGRGSLDLEYCGLAFNCVFLSLSDLCLLSESECLTVSTVEEAE